MAESLNKSKSNSLDILHSNEEESKYCTSINARLMKKKQYLLITNL